MKIITIFDRNENFIEFQYKSIIKHVKGQYEYIVFNNARSSKQANIIKKTCEALGVKCIRIRVMYAFRNPSQIAGIALNKAFKKISHTNESFLKLDSDMFFIGDVNLEELLEENSLVYIPTYVPRKTMWSGVFGINLKKVKFDFDFRPGVIPQTDTFGQSCLIVNDDRYSQKILDLYNLQDFKDGVIETSLNGNCVMKFDKTGLIFKENSNFAKTDTSVLNKIYIDILGSMEKYNFPKPYNIDFISLNGKNFIVHFKSSNWCPWYTKKYVLDKKNSLEKLLANTIS